MVNQITLAFTVSTVGTIFTPAAAAAKLAAVKLYDNPQTDPVLGQAFGLTVATDITTAGVLSATRTLTLNMTSAVGAPLAPPFFPAHPVTSTPPVPPYPLIRTETLPGEFILTNGPNLVTTTETQIPSLSAGDTVEFLSQLGVFYQVLLVVDAATILLTTPFTGMSATSGARRVRPAPAKRAAFYSTNDLDTAGLLLSPVKPGPGAQSVSLVYLDSTGAGPFSTDVHLSGKLPAQVTLAAGSLDIATIVDIRIETVGDFKNSVGQITLSELTADLPFVPVNAPPIRFHQLTDESQGLLSRALAYLPPSYFALAQQGNSKPQLEGDFLVTTDSDAVFTTEDQTSVLLPGDLVQFAAHMANATPFATLEVTYEVRGVGPQLITLVSPYRGLFADRKASGAYKVDPTLATPPSAAELKAPLGQYTGAAGFSEGPPPPPNPTVLSDIFAQTISLALAVQVVAEPIGLV
jgi:hypothetical protein